ncbi:hypothetical protein B0H16DRAFT_1611876 [Mycena metata]|uniref:HCP-like protein n=1 Tax=Mycena metata TaxID=1033252 RepID=A0AAD7HC00_9AGAR|nr:hypothetical protein B0H16DRAFT_1611876 [Mycena metata]
MMAAASYPDQQHFHLQHSSPLDTLVRKTSTRKPNNLSSHEQIQAAREQRRYPQGLPQLNTTERLPYQVHHAAPSSPLLHSHFNRQSNATWASSNDNNSYLDLSREEYNGVQEVEYGNDYDMSSPETDHASSPALRDSWQSSGDAHTIRPGEDGDWPAVPTVMISEPEQVGYRAGKTPIIRPTTANFSRPARSAVEVPMEWENEQKQRVLERNASRRTAPNTPDTSAHQSFWRPDSTSSSVYSHDTSRPPSQPPSRGRTPEPPQQHQPGEPLQLLRRPPSLRAGSPVSLYSNYSFYQLDSATPSPTDKQFQSNRPGPSQPSPKHIKFANTSPAASPLSRSPSTTSAAPATRTALEFLQLGITHHEADRLAESAVCFERAATLDGGCGVGMLMWGLALRHGWGCAKNEKHGFKWLRRAAESAVSDLEAARTGGEIDQSAVQTELVLAIYEVGQCFFHGWGIPKDQKMGVSYYAVAARMGDADAQMDLAFCLANGKGTKKDRKQAAKWYRDAVKQGQSDIGLAWIYKEKFQ